MCSPSSPRLMMSEATTDLDRVLLADLAQAIEGLMISVKTVSVDLVDRGADRSGSYPLGAVLTELGLTSKPISVQTVSQFFEPYSVEQSWQDDSQRAVSGRFRRLRDLVTSRLVGATVLQISEVDLTILVVGRLPSGAWVELKTSLVET
ncbi:MAG: nuclease A inhibitor family protein [Polyangiaceae bacterium]